MEEALHSWRLQVLEPFDIRDKLTTLNDYELRTAQNNEYGCTHVFLINDNSPENLHNFITFQFIKSCIHHTFYSGDIIEGLENSITKHLISYLKPQNEFLNFNEKFKVKIDWDNDIICPIPKLDTTLIIREYKWDKKYGTIYFTSSAPNNDEMAPYSILLSDEGIELEIEMPGVNPSQIQINRDNLEISYKSYVYTNLMTENRSGELHHQRRKKDRFFSFHIPNSYATEKKDWKIKKLDGVLFVFIPKITKELDLVI